MNLSSAASERPAEGIPPGRPRRILLAEDDAALSRVLAERLKGLGAQVTKSPDASHALFLMIKNDVPDLVVLDIRMPSGNGLAVCEMMRDDARLAEVPVIIISGVASEQDEARVERLNAHFIRKSADVWAAMKPLCEQLLFGSSRS